MTTNQPDSIENRLSRLETLFADIGETVLAQNDTIDVLVTNINHLNENINNLAEQTTRNINALAEQTTRNINALAEQAAQDRAQAAEDRAQAAEDRQQTAIDRQQAAIDRQEWQAEIQRIWQYLLQQGGNGRTST